MSVQFISSIGNRLENEDQYNVILNIDGKDLTKHDINLYCIFDGHGGDFVSKYLHHYVPSLLMDIAVKHPCKKTEIIKMFKSIQDKLKTKYYDKTLECGSTCLVVKQFMEENNMYLEIFNIGDCRCVLCNYINLAIPLTKDHKPNYPDECARIMKINKNKIKYAYNDVPRINGLSVSRSIGDISAEPEVIYIPDMFRYKINKNDKFIVLACDGLWDVLSSQDVVNFILFKCYDIHSGKKNNYSNVSNDLVNLALSKGTTDNVTIIIVFFQ